MNDILMISLLFFLDNKCVFQLLDFVRHLFHFEEKIMELDFADTYTH